MSVVALGGSAPIAQVALSCALRARSLNSASASRKTVKYASKRPSAQLSKGRAHGTDDNLLSLADNGF